MNIPTDFNVTLQTKDGQTIASRKDFYDDWLEFGRINKHAEEELSNYCRQNKVKLVSYSVVPNGVCAIVVSLK